MARCKRVASTYSRDNHAIYDGVSRPGSRIVTFAPMLKHGTFPLAEILDVLVRAGEDAPGQSRWKSNLPCRLDAVDQLAAAKYIARIWISANSSTDSRARHDEDLALDDVATERN